MPFASEEKLVRRFEQLFCSSASGSWKWIREFNTSSGIADLIGFEPIGDDASYEQLAQIPTRLTYALLSLPVQRPFEVMELATLANLSISSARAALQSYCRSGYCRHTEKPTHWIKTTNPMPIAKRIVAIEAKLRDWRRALYQASQHTTYASSSWVVLDIESIPAATIHVDEFANRGVGLAGISVDGDIEIVVEARENHPRMPIRFWQANTEIARRLRYPYFRYSR